MGSSYRVIWMAGYPAPSGPGPNTCPFLCTEERLLEMQAATQRARSIQMPEIDFLGGIAHELWKDDALLETSKAALRAEWERICGVMGWGDDKEAQWVTVTDHCREHYGTLCSLHQMFSAVQACPMSVQLNHNLLCNVLNVMQDGDFESLDENAWRQTLRSLRDVSDIVPVTHFKGHEFTAFGVTTLYAIALASEGDTARVQSFVNFAMTNIPLDPSRKASFAEISAMSEEQAVMGLRMVANANRRR